MQKILLLLVLAASTGLAQYTYHTTTTTFPPEYPQFLQMSDGSGGYLTVQQSTAEGGEVRTILAAPQYANQWVSYKQYLGMFGQPDSWWDPQFYRYSGYTVQLSGVPGSSYPWTLTITRQYTDGNFNYVYTQLASYTVSAPITGTALSSSLRRIESANTQSAGINIRLGTQTIFYRIHPDNIQLGGNYYGFGIESGPMAEVDAGNIDITSPNSTSGLVAPITNGVINAAWNATTDNATGIGAIRYEVFKQPTSGGAVISLGTTATPNWTLFVNPGENFYLSVKAYDGHRSFNDGTQVAVSVPSTTTGGALIDDSLRTGIHSRSVQWGAMGESIDLRSMNMNYTIPLLKAQGRAGVGLGVSLSYNSQNWRKENSTVTKSGADVGYGFGWRLQAGSIFPVFTNPTTLSYYIFTDATGAQYKLDRQVGNVWNSKEGIAVWFDTSTYNLYFPDGSFWQMGCTSAASEQDAGTRYPTLVQDRHGNQIAITYAGAIGGGAYNSSARLWRIDDVRSTAASNWVTYSFTYNTDAIPHLTGITNNINTGESYTLNYSASQALYEPFNGTQQFGSAVWLNSLTQNGVNLTTSFQYNSGGEMTKITFPLGGEMMWNYTNQSYAGGRQAREVLSRDLRKAPGAATVNYAFTHPAGDSSLKYHSETTLADPSNVGQRRWTFFTTTDFKQGLISKYEELDNWTVKSRSETTWTEVLTGWPQMNDVTNTIDVGQSFQKQWRTVPYIDAYGITSGGATYAYGSPGTLVKSHLCYFAGSNSNYSARYIYYIPNTCQTTENGVTLTSGTATMDAQTLAAVPNDIRLWTNPNSPYRALVTSINDGFTTRSATYNLAGQPVSGGDGQGLNQSKR